jgi:hypothetical protein
MAIKAHDEETKITCTGELKKEGKFYWLNNALGFKRLVESE